MTHFKVGQEIKTRSGKIGIIRALDWKDNKIVSAGVEIKDGQYVELVHQLIHNIMPI